MEPRSDQSNSESVRAVTRIADILEAFVASDQALTLTKVAKEVGIPKSTAHRYMRALIARGLCRDTGDGRYGLGPRVVTFGRHAERSFKIIQIAAPHMERLALDVELTTYLCVEAVDRVLCLHRVEGKFAHALDLLPGGTAQWDGGATGWVLTSFRGPASGLEPTNSDWVHRVRTLEIQDHDLSLVDIQKAIRDNGHAIFDAPNGTTGIAAPVFNADGVCIASISASDLSTMTVLNEREVCLQVMRTACALSAELGAPRRMSSKHQSGSSSLND